MGKIYRRCDEDAELFENGALRDGKTWRVPLYMCDSLQKSVAQSFADVQLTDEQLALHRPGYRVGATDASARDAKQAAQDEYLNWLTNAWRNPMRNSTGEIIGTPDQTQDVMTTDIGEVYAAYEAEISQRWKGPGR